MSFETDFKELLIQTATIYSKSRTTTPNSFGEKSYTLVSNISDVPCSVQPVKEQLSFDLHGTTYIASENIFCDYGYKENIHPGDLITVDSITYLILGVPDDGGQRHHLKVFVTKN
jgi:hypothetical protein